MNTSSWKLPSVESLVDLKHFANKLNNIHKAYIGIRERYWRFFICLMCPITSFNSEALLAI